MTAKKPSALLRPSHDIPLGGYYPLYQNSVDTFFGQQDSTDPYVIFPG